MSTHRDASGVYSIETANKPFVFRVAPESLALPALAAPAGQQAIKVEVRSLPGMQKEAIVSALAPQAGVWRIVCDEGPYLNGTDLAPFPLAFYTAGLQFSLIFRVLAAAKSQNVALNSLQLSLDNYYTMKGSFIKGDATGGAKPAEALIRIESGADEGALRGVVQNAVQCCPGQSLMRDVLDNVFSLHVNGQAVPVSGIGASGNLDDPDPQATTFAEFSAEPDGAYLDDIITKTGTAKTAHDVEGGISSSLKPVQDRTLHVNGQAQSLGGTRAHTDIQLRSPIGSNFRLISEEPDGAGANLAPSGLAYLSAGVGFCYMTQLSRYAHIAKLDIDSIRIVQHTRFGADGRALPVDTHVFVETAESPETFNNLIAVGERTCFLHAAMRGSYPTRVQVEFNGKALAL